MPRTTGKPDGAPPTDIDVIADRLVGGQPILARELLLRNVESGLGIAAAAQSAGLNARTLTLWRQRGGIARAREATGQTLSAKEQRYAEFTRQIERAEIEAELVRVRVIDVIARGGYPITKTVEERDANNRLIRVVTTTTTLAPNWHAAAWWLARRRPGYLERIEITDPSTAPPVEDVAATLEESLRVFLEGAAAQQAADDEAKKR